MAVAGSKASGCGATTKESDLSYCRSRPAYPQSRPIENAKKYYIRAAMILTSAVIGISPGYAAEYLTSVTSEVYQTEGTKQEIARRAETCIAQKLAAGTTDSQLIISSDVANGIIVARNVTTQGSFPQFKIRSRFTFEARDGRFRIEQTGLERFDDSFGNGWTPIGKWSGSQWKKAEAAFTLSAVAVADCVIVGPKKDQW